MDAYGNLTSQDEFSGGRRVRIISYLGQDLAVGATGRVEPGFDQIPMLVDPAVSLHHLSSGDPDRTVFVAEASSTGFTLGMGANPDVKLAFGGYRASLGLIDTQVNSIMEAVEDPSFVVEFVDGVWFNLRSPDGALVLDCAGSGTDEGQPLLGWDGNGGDNQKWRAEAA